MTLVILFVIASVFSSILVIAAGMLSSRSNRRERFVETYYTEPAEMRAEGSAQTE